MSLFDPDGKFMQITSTMLDYVKLGLLFMLFSIPVIPMGAAAAAAMTVGMKIARGEAPAVWKPFWKAFKENFRQGTLLLLIFALAFALLGFDWYQVMKMESTTVVRVARAGIVLLTILLTSIALYSFAIIARYELAIKAALQSLAAFSSASSGIGQSGRCTRHSRFVWMRPCPIGNGTPAPSNVPSATLYRSISRS